MAIKKTMIENLEGMAAPKAKVEGTGAPKTKAEGTTAPKTKTKAEEPKAPTTEVKEDNIRTYVLEDGNITLHIEGDKLLIAECDLTKILGPSKSGKSDMISATTGVAGIELPDMPGYCLQLKLYRMHDKPSRPAWKKAK